MNYLDKVKAQLMKMSKEEKDTWILSQAKLVSEHMQDDFLSSLSGKKKIIDMPSLDEIDKFCKQVENGEVYFEYETHYYEFDENGKYMDDWKFWYNDPFAIIPRIDRILAGCHSLLCLEEYQIVFELLSRIFELQFFVKDSEDSDDISEEKIISLSDVGEKGMLSNDLSSAAEDCIKSFTYLTEGQDNQKRAHKIIEMLEHSVYQ